MYRILHLVVTMLLLNWVVMPTLELTKRIIDSLLHSKEYQQLYFDVKQRGFGLRVSADTIVFTN